MRGAIIQGLVILNSPNHVPQRRQATCLFYALLLFNVIFNTILVKHLPKTWSLSLIIHISGRTVENGVRKDCQFFVAVVTGVHGFLGADSACHIA